MTPRIKIVVDSSADLLALSEIPFSSVPLRIVAEGREYIDNARLNVEQMGNELCTYSGSTSVFCPSAGEWVDAFGDADFVFCVTSSITGGTDAVNLAKKLYETLHHDRQVYVIRSHSIGPESRLIVEKLQELIMADKPFAEICTETTAYQEQIESMIMHKSIKNILSNEQLESSATRPVGILNVGTIGIFNKTGKMEVVDKYRGSKSVIPHLMEQLKIRGFNGRKIRIAQCFDEETALTLRECIASEYPQAQIEIYPCRGFCSYYTEKGGMLIGFETA